MTLDRTQVLHLRTATGRAAGDVRTVTGVAVQFGQVFERYGVRMQFAPGSLTLPEHLSDVKFLQDHDSTKPLGYLAGWIEDESGANVTLEVPDIGDAARVVAEIDALLRDGLSVGVQFDADTWDQIEDLMGTEQTEALTLTGRLLEVSTVTIPQLPGARAGTSTNHTERTITMSTSTVEQVEQTPAPAAAPAVTMSATRTRPVDAVRALADHLVTAYQREGQGGLALALADITPAGNGVGSEIAGLGLQALGELCGADVYDPIYDVAVRSRELTGMELVGWKWTTPPTVADYAGNKTEIPTNAAKLEAVRVTAKRLAGGHDLDRVYVDLGGGEVLASYWRLMGRSMGLELDKRRLAAIQTAAGTPGTATSLADAILKGLGLVPGADVIIVGNAVWAGAGAVPASDLPAIISGGGIFADPLDDVTVIRDTTGSLGAEVIVAERDATIFATLNPAIRVEAVNVPLAGIDAGLYGYYASLDGCDAAAVRYTVGAAGAGAGRK